MIVNYACSVINELKALLTDGARVVIYDHHVFTVQATEFHATNPDEGHRHLVPYSQHSIFFVTYESTQ
jgi:hypothetical protein